MEKYFKTEQGELVNIVEHTLEQLKKWPDLKIRIGTDSQNYTFKRKTKKIAVSRYVTTIVYRYGSRGAHYIYYMEEVPRVRSEWTRLYDEGIRTIEAADLLQEEIPVQIEALEFDYNDHKKTLSSQLVQTFKNWGSFNGVFKSGEMIACKAADHVCRK